MSELEYFLHKGQWQAPEPRTDAVPEDARTIIVKPCAMGTEQCETALEPLTTTCACGFRKFEPRVGYKLADLNMGPCR